MDLSEIIVKPYHTEKSYGLRNQEKVVLTFVVHKAATKTSIKLAFESIYGIKPEKVNVLKKKPTSVKTGTKTPGRSKLMKIAYIILPEGIDVALTQEEMDAASKAQSEAATQTKKKTKKEDVKVESTKTKTTPIVKAAAKKPAVKTAKSNAKISTVKPAAKKPAIKTVKGASKTSR